MAVNFLLFNGLVFSCFPNKKWVICPAPLSAVRGRRLTGCAWGEDTVTGCARAVPRLITSITRAADPAHMHGNQCVQH